MKLNVALTVAGVAAAFAAVHAAPVSPKSSGDATASVVSIERRSGIQNGISTLAARSPGNGISESLNVASIFKSNVEDTLAAGTGVGYVRLRSSSSAREDSTSSETLPQQTNRKYGSFSFLDSVTSLKNKVKDLLTAPGKGRGYSRLRPSPSAKAEPKSSTATRGQQHKVETPTQLQRETQQPSETAREFVQRQQLEYQRQRQELYDQAKLAKQAKLDAEKRRKLEDYAYIQAHNLKIDGVVGLPNFQPGVELKPEVARVRAQELIDMGANHQTLSTLFVGGARGDLFHRSSNGLSRTGEAAPSVEEVARRLEDGTLMLWHNPMRPSESAHHSV